MLPLDTIATLEKCEPKSEGIDTPRKKKPKGNCGHHGVLHWLCRFPSLRPLLSGVRLHVLGSRRRSPTVWPHRGRPLSLYRVQEVHQQRA